MITQDKQLEFGTTQIYVDIEPEYLNFIPGIRVLPAPYFSEPSTMFTLKAKHEPGDKHYPNGGYEVYGPSGETRSYCIDQVIVHPWALNQMKFFARQTIPANKTQVIDPNAPKRGRGRPANPNTVSKADYVPTGGKRGRKADPNKVAKAGATRIVVEKEITLLGANISIFSKDLGEEQASDQRCESSFAYNLNPYPYKWRVYEFNCNTELFKILEDVEFNAKDERTHDYEYYKNKQGDVMLNVGGSSDHVKVLFKELCDK
jgi:hypothetical protein